MKSSDLLEVAKLGKVVGLRGELKLHLTTDFPNQFKSGKQFILNPDQKLTVESYNQNRGLIKFKEIKSREDASKYVNKRIFSTMAETKDDCPLGENEYFWFDIVGCEIIEMDEVLGVVKDIEDMASSNYLLIDTDRALIDLPKSFYIPYIDRYIDRVDIEAKKVYTKDAKAILENS